MTEITMASGTRWRVLPEVGEVTNAMRNARRSMTADNALLGGDPNPFINFELAAGVKRMVQLNVSYIESYQYIP